MDMECSLLMTGSDVAKELKISRALAYRWMQQGLLPTVRIAGGRTVRVPRHALLDWVRSQTHQPVAVAAPGSPEEDSGRYTNTAGPHDR